MLFKASGLRLFLAALLFFAQQQGLLHLLEHGFEQIEKKNPANPREPVCAKCLALAHLDHALSGTAPPIALPDARPAMAPAAAVGPAEFAFVPIYRSRAPPAFS